jgi:hypothetical protein
MASWLDIKAMLYKLLSVLSTILLLLIIMRNPMLWDEDYKKLKHVVPKHTNMTRQIPAASAEIRYGAQIDLTSEAHKKKVFQYLRDTVLHDSQLTQKQQSAVTPLHKTMLLMGCYGDRWGPARHVGMHSIDDILSQAYMQHNTSARPAFFVNLMLQAFDSYDAERVLSGHNFTQSQHDRSVCSCLRDFASPSLLHVENGGAAAESCDDKTYKHDTCTVQRLLDYAVDSSEAVTDGTPIQLEQMVVATSGSPARRNLPDPILAEISTYESSLKTKFTATTYENTLMFNEPDPLIVELKSFLLGYCQYARFHDNSPAAKALECPLNWYNADGTWKTALLVKEAIEQIKKWPKHMHAYNKLRTPTQLNTESFRTYIEKYKVAFETCSAVGVQTYSTQITGRTQYIHWYISGELFLLLASSLSFLWARIIHHYVNTDAEVKDSAVQSANQPEQSENQETGCCPDPWTTVLSVLRWLYSILNVLMILALIIIIFFYSSKFVLQELEDSSTVSQYGRFITGFVSVYIILGILTVLLCAAVFMQTIASDVYKALGYGRKPYEALAVTPENGVDTKENVRKHIFWAQIALDLPVILGITFMAVGTTLQRGVADYNLILTVLVLLTTTGVTTHITNVLRLMHLKVQTKENKNDKLHAIKYNRVVIGLIIALMLVVFLNLAGLDSVQGSEFSSLHQTIFAIVAFVIFVCGDLSLEAKSERFVSVAGSPSLLKEPWALSFFLHGLGSTLFTAVGSQQHREITISRKRAKKKCHGP